MSTNRKACLVITLAWLALAPATALGELPEDGDRPGDVRLILPPTIYAVPGVEANIYFDNVVLVLNPANYAFEVISEHGNQFDDRWVFNPKPEQVGSFPLSIVVRDAKNDVIAKASTTVRVSPADAAAKVSLLLVGDSLTDTRYSHYPHRLLELDAADTSLDLRLIGSRGEKDLPPTGPLRHEGYGGWGAQAFATSNGTASRTGTAKRPDTGSPFVYGEGSNGKLDFARYCGEFNDGNGPDAILILLGSNDVFRANDSTIDATIEKSLGHFDALIAEFHRVRPDTAVGVVLITPPTRSQHGFRNYKGDRRQTRAQFRRNQHRLIEKMVERYAGREAQRVFLVPGFVNLDTTRAFPTYAAAANAHAEEKVLQVLDGVHPSREGHFQIADSIYSWLKAVATPTQANGE